MVPNRTEDDFQTPTPKVPPQCCIPSVVAKFRKSQSAVSPEEAVSLALTDWHSGERLAQIIMVMPEGGRVPEDCSYCLTATVLSDLGIGYEVRK